MSSVHESSSICRSSSGQIPEYVCIDYPGNVVNVSNMLDTLGGTQMISKVHSESNRRLELRFRPLDVYCKPACGERSSSTSLLVKIRRRRRVAKKSASSSTCNDESREEIHTSLMGVVNTTYVFNTLCDAQYLPLLTAEDAIPLTSTSGSTTCTTSATETTSVSENTSVTPRTESVDVTATATSSTTVTDDDGTGPGTSDIGPDLDSDSSSYLPYNCFAPQHLEMPSWLHEQPQCLFLPPAAFSRMDTPQFFFFRGDGSESFIKKEQSKAHSSRAVIAVTTPLDHKSGSSDSTRVSSTADCTALSTVTATVSVALGSSGDFAVTSTSGATAAVATASTSDGAASCTPNIICHTRQRRTLFAIFRNYADATPMQPEPQALQQLQLKFLQRSIVPIYDKLKALFEERPIWSRNALKVMLGYGSDSLKYLLPTVGYYFSTGPWRNLWVKFSYDPREKPNSFIYQTFDYRLRQTGVLKNLIEAKRSYSNYILPYKSSSASKRKISVIQSDLLGSGPICDASWQDSSASLTDGEPIIAGVEAGAMSKPIADIIKRTITKMKRDEDDDGDSVEMDEEDSSSESFKDEVYIFRPGSIPPYRQMFYQYCDLLVPEIQQVLEKAVLSTSSRLRCDERFGWLSKCVEEDCRRIVTKLIEDAVHKRTKLDKE